MQAWVLPVPTPARREGGGTTWTLAFPEMLVHPPLTYPLERWSRENVCLRASCCNFTHSLTHQEVYESAMMVMFQPTTILRLYCITIKALTMESIIVLVSPSFLLPGLLLTYFDRRLVKINNQSMHQDIPSLQSNVP